MSSPTNRVDSNAEETPNESECSTTETKTEDAETNAGQETANAMPAVSYNPSVSSDDEDNEEELARIKGDAIGDTLYSERFVLSTLLKLTKLEDDLAHDETFEKDLCALWDMTIEEDVVQLLLEHNVLELLAQCIEATQDKRLTEILVGIMGNMCSIERARSELCAHSDIIGTILQLIACSDTLTLVQIMRLIAVVLVFDDPVDAPTVWYQQVHLMPTFVEHFSFILQNSVNVTLLTHALEALNALLAKFSVIDSLEDSTLTFSNIFVREPLICGTLEAFKLLVPTVNADARDESTLPSQATRKTMQIFLNIHVIFAQFKDAAKTAYDNKNLQLLLDCISQVLAPLCVPQYLLPVTSNMQDVIMNVDDIFVAFDYPFHKRCLTQLITIWHLTKRHAKRDDVDICSLSLLFVMHLIVKSNDLQLEEALRQQRPQTILKLLDAIKGGHLEKDICECREKLNKAFDSLNTQAAAASKS